MNPNWASWNEARRNYVHFKLKLFCQNAVLNGERSSRRYNYYFSERNDKSPDFNKKKERNKETPMKLPKLLQFRRRMCDNYLHRIYHPHMWKLLLLFWLDLIVRFNLMFSLELLRSTLFLEKIFSDAVPPCTSHSDWTIQRMNSFFPSIKTSHVSRYGIAFIETV